MGLATLAVTEVSHGTEQADGGALRGPDSAGPEARVWAPEASNSAEADGNDSLCHDTPDHTLRDTPSDDAAAGDALDATVELGADDALDATIELGADDELDATVELGDEIATLAAHLHAATYRLLTLIAEFDRLRGWEPGGHRSCAHWLAYRTGIDLGAAREKVRAARALVELPQISASMAQGELSFAKVRALTRVAKPESEGDLLELARCSTAAQLERTVRAWRRLSRWDEQELERMRHRSRCFSVFPDEEGMYLVRGRLDPEVGAMLMRAVDAASDALFRAEVSEEIEPKQRRADAVGLLAEQALAVGFGSGGVQGAEAEGENTGDGNEGMTLEGEGMAGGSEGAAGVGEGTASVGEGEADGVEGTGAEGTAAGVEGTAVEDKRAADRKAAGDIPPISGTRAERYQVVLHVEAATLENESEPGRSELEDGTRVSAETSRRLSCDASVVRLGEGPDGSILDVGRKTRTIPPALRRALESRDRGCRFPGCGLRFTDAHHVRHWADGGETKLDNLVLLCRFHHRLVHEEGYTVHFPRGGRVNSPNQRLYFLDPRMRLLPDVPPPAPPLPAPLAPTPPAPPQPAEALVRANMARGVEPDFRTSTARYRREDDVPQTIFIRALEALEGRGRSPAGVPRAACS